MLLLRIKVNYEVIVFIIVYRSKLKSNQFSQIQSGLYIMCDSQGRRSGRISKLRYHKWLIIIVYSKKSTRTDLVFCASYVMHIAEFSRVFVSRYWFSPIGISLGIKNTRSKKAQLNAVLEKAYLAGGGKLKHRQLTGLAKQLDWTERQVERWLRLRRSQDKPSTLTKFCENSWRCLYYFCSFVYGVVVLWDKPWFWDINMCWKNYPHQVSTPKFWAGWKIGGGVEILGWLWIVWGGGRWWFWDGGEYFGVESGGRW